MRGKGGCQECRSSAGGRFCVAEWGRVLWRGGMQAIVAPCCIQHGQPANTTGVYRSASLPFQ